MSKKQQTDSPVAVIDIGSNAVRLVIYNGYNRCPMKTHTERLICGLGRSIQNTGRLDPEGVQQALDSLARFSGIINALKIKNVLPIATAALRDAEDGPKFVATVKEKFNIDINVISGIEEARLSALGVMAGFGNVSGVVGDFGGGSLELISIENNKILEQDTLPLGALRILALKTEKERRDYIQDHLADMPLLKDNIKKNLYILGGAWRSIGKAHIHMTGYPIHVIDHYSLRYTPALEFTQLLSQQSAASLERMAGMSKKRVKDIPPAALVLSYVLKYLKPQHTYFSGTGLREGAIYDHLSPTEQKRQPLITSCSDVSGKSNRSGDIKSFQYMAKWLAPLFQNTNIDDFDTILEAACLLSDLGWYEHEDHRAAHAYQRILRFPLYGMSHTSRAILALATYVRYQGYLRRVPRSEKTQDEITAPAQSVLTRSQVDVAIQLGLSIRLAHLLTGSVLPLLKHAELRLTDKILRLVLKGKTIALSGNVIQESLDDLAKFHKCRSMITLSQ